jgi:acyl-CoA synthetase (NDP forming)
VSRLAALLTPKSIALVGCPADLSRPGARPLLYLRKHGYPGRIYPVNPRHREIGGLPAWPALGALPERPDVVWIGVPGPEVEAVLAEAARLKVPGVVILTAGFGETGEAGRARQERLARLAEQAGITVLGPNMLGFINCWDRVPLTFSPAGGLEELIPGPLGVASQSGALGGIVVNRAFDRRIGISAMVSTGNEIGVTVSECLEYFADDPRTQAVALVAEGIRDGERFKRAAGRLLAAGKALVALKLGRSRSGRRNALTHTGALAGSWQAWRAVARQYGIVEVETFEELVEVAGFLARERRVVRRGVAVVATSGGASILTADHLEEQGVRLPRLAPATVTALARRLPDYAVTRDNPVDVTAGLTEDLFAEVLSVVAADPHVDAVLATVTGARGAERAENVARVARQADRPIVVCWLGGSLTAEGVGFLDRRGVPCFLNPRTAALALAAGRRVAAARGRRPWSTPAPLRIAPVSAAPRSYAALADLARRLGVPLAAESLVATPAAAARAARRLGFPVAVKLVAPDLPHKTEAGAVALDLRSPGAVRRAAAAMLARAGRRPIEGLLVQRMARGVEVLAGVTRDPTFGLLLVVGAGGVHAEALGQVTSRPLPVSRRDLYEMLGEVPALGALRGWRGAPPADRPALVAALAAVARLAAALGDDLVGLDVNPIIAGPRGAVAVDLLAQFADRVNGRAIAGLDRIEVSRVTRGRAER